MKASRTRRNRCGDACRYAVGRCQIRFLKKCASGRGKVVGSDRGSVRLIENSAGAVRGKGLKFARRGEKIRERPRRIVRIFSSRRRRCRDTKSVRCARGIMTAGAAGGRDGERITLGGKVKKTGRCARML